MEGYRQHFDDSGTSHLRAEWTPGAGRGESEMDRMMMDMLRKQARAQRAPQRRLGQGGVGGGGGAPAPTEMPRTSYQNRPLERRPERKQGVAMYIKPMTGFNMSGGYSKAQPWEQGAVFAGYAPEGYDPNPQHSAMASVPGYSAGLTAGDEAGIQREALRGAAAGGGAPERSGVDFERDRFAAAYNRSNREYDDRVAQAQAQQEAIRRSYLGG